MSEIKDKRGLSITMIFKAQSLNYGEGIGNISELKNYQEEMEVLIHLLQDKL